MKRRSVIAGLTAGALAGCTTATPRPRAATALPQVQVLPPMAMPGLGRERVVRVFVPASHANGTQRYPVIYLHDGQNLFDDATSYVGEWGVDETLAAQGARGEREFIAVGIDHGGERRFNELNPWSHARLGPGEGHDYLRFVVDVVKPFVDARWRTLPGREHTAVAGSSMGGVISHAALHLHPGVFSRAGVLSPAYWTAPALFDLARTGPLPADARLYLSMGTREGERAMDDVQRMDALLTQRGAGRHTLRVVDGAEHNEAAWRVEFPRMLAWLFDR